MRGKIKEEMKKWQIRDEGHIYREELQWSQKTNATREKIILILPWLMET